VPETTPTDVPLRIFLFIENRLIREALVRLLRKRPDLCVVGQGSSTEVIDVHGTQCDILVADNLQVVSEHSVRLFDAHAAKGTVRVVLIGMEENEDQFLLAVRSGVSGYLLNDASASDVVSAVRAAARGEAVCPPRMCLALFHTMARLAREAPVQIKKRPLPSLTMRQQQLLCLVAKGLTNKEIALRLNLSEFTVKNHIHRIMKQVEGGNRYEVVEAARASGYALPA
jgi:DNA-binding NarL/FixJ family response regulator